MKKPTSLASRLLLCGLLAAPALAFPVETDAEGCRWVEVPEGARLAEVAARTGVPWRILAAANRDALLGERRPPTRLAGDGRRRLRLRLDLPPSPEPDGAPAGPRRLAFGGDLRAGLERLLGLLQQLQGVLPSPGRVSLRPSPRPAPRVAALPRLRPPSPPSSGPLGVGPDTAVGSVTSRPRVRPAPTSGTRAGGSFNERLPLERGTYRISSRFGTRGGRHLGIDLAAAAGVPIHATGPAVVRRAALSASYGNVVYLDHVDGDRLTGVQTRYAHMRRTPRVREDPRTPLPAGTRLGEVGTTGRSSGNHLHFEVRRLRAGSPLGRALRFPSSSARDPADDFRF